MNDSIICVALLAMIIGVTARSRYEDKRLYYDERPHSDNRAYYDRRPYYDERPYSDNRAYYDQRPYDLEYSDSRTHSQDMQPLFAKPLFSRIGGSMKRQEDGMRRKDEDTPMGLWGWDELDEYALMLINEIQALLQKSEALALKSRYPFW